MKYHFRPALCPLFQAFFQAGFDKLGNEISSLATSEPPQERLVGQTGNCFGGRFHPEMTLDE